MYKLLQPGEGSELCAGSDTENYCWEGQCHCGDFIFDVTILENDCLPAGLCGCPGYYSKRLLMSARVSVGTGHVIE